MKQSPPSPRTAPDSGAALAEWLEHLEAAHPQEIELGLERVAAVGAELGVLEPGARVITVGGTNGKGTVARTLEALLGASGLSAGLYTSPHLTRFEERIRLRGREVAAEPLVAAFERVEAARRRCGVSLTYFEHTTLAAFDLFAREGVAVWVLEVGLGGRLDAVNTVDPDVAVVTRVALDHCDLLGSTLDAVAREKAGIFRGGRPAVIGQEEAPQALLEGAYAVDAQPCVAGRDFRIGVDGQRCWSVQVGDRCWGPFDAPSIPGRAALMNAATAVVALDRLPGYELSTAALAEGLRDAHIPGRLQRFECAGLEWLLDVAHNADGATELATVLDEGRGSGRCHAIVGVAQRKDAEAILAALIGRVDEWYAPAALAGDMRSGRELAALIRGAGGAVAHSEADMAATLREVKERASAGDRVVVFGSFRVVAAVLAEQGWG